MIVVNCIGHSGFSVETESHFFIFDYYEGKLPRVPAQKRTYIFISHSHPDHYNPEIFRLGRENPDIRYVISQDVPADSVHSHGIKKYYVAEAGLDCQLEKHLHLRVLNSTDIGVAFIVGCMGRNIFHAGDLNYWIWPGMTESESYTMSRDFRSYTLPLRNYIIDTAFLPLDSRQGIYSFLGVDYYMKHFRIKNAIPMHFNGSPKICDQLLAEPNSREYRNRIIKMKSGDKISLN